MFALVILVGARRAFRHPERYGRRDSDDSQGPQTTAGGIAQAILDTFPVIKFNRSSRRQEEQFRGAQPKRISSERELRSVVLPELSSPRNPREALPRRSLTEESETYHTASEEYDESLKDRITPSGSRRASRNDLGNQSLVEGAGEAMEDQCPICLLDFEEGDDLRVLPCEREHVYHQSCIDPWLLEVSGSCPLCRKGAQASHPRRRTDSSRFQQSHPRPADSIPYFLFPSPTTPTADDIRFPEVSGIHATRATIWTTKGRDGGFGCGPWKEEGGGSDRSWGLLDESMDYKIGCILWVMPHRGFVERVPLGMDG